MVMNRFQKVPISNLLFFSCPDENENSASSNPPVGRAFPKSSDFVTDCVEDRPNLRNKAFLQRTVNGALIVKRQLERAFALCQWG